MNSAGAVNGITVHVSVSCCVDLCADVINISECEAVTQSMFDFTPNENGCTVVRMKRGSKMREKIHSARKKVGPALIPCP